mmetsp:Transcript_2187/g.4009  ORF Transcript_2187/g.4009 Transcript_2187/m.4009 type:complete len:207 (+) Transcript_2187:223-843(+)
MGDETTECQSTQNLWPLCGPESCTITCTSKTIAFHCGLRSPGEIHAWMHPWSDAQAVSVERIMRKCLIPKHDMNSYFAHFPVITKTKKRFSFALTYAAAPLWRLQASTGRCWSLLAAAAGRSLQAIRGLGHFLSAHRQSVIVAYWQAKPGDGMRHRQCSCGTHDCISNSTTTHHAAQTKRCPSPARRRGGGFNLEISRLSMCPHVA